MDVKNILGPIGCMVPGLIPPQYVTDFVVRIIPATIIPVNMTAMELIVTILQVISLAAGLTWIGIQIYIKWPELKKRIKKSKHETKN